MHTFRGENLSGFNYYIIEVFIPIFQLENC